MRLAIRRAAFRVSSPGSSERYLAERAGDEGLGVTVAPLLRPDWARQISDVVMSMLVSGSKPFALHIAVAAARQSGALIHCPAAFATAILFGEKR